MEKKKYFAFISYSHKDSELAKWLQHEFEYYELPSKLFEERKDLRKEDFLESFRPVFRDEDELAGGELKPQISEALADSEYLIVVCSPNSAQSIYVDNEIKEFISLTQDNKRRIFPFIVDGKPHQDEEHKEMECFPKTILELSEDKKDPIELIAGDIDIHEKGRGHAFVKVLAGTLKEKGIQFADLWNRYAIEKVERERKEREEKEKLQIVQSRFLAEKANQLVDEGDSYLASILSLKALPTYINNPNRPYVLEAEMALRRSTQKEDAFLMGHNHSVVSSITSHDGSRFFSTSWDKKLCVWDTQSGRLIVSKQKHTKNINSVALNQDGSLLATASDDKKIILWDTRTIRPKGKSINFNSAVNHVSFSPCGKYILAALANDSVCVADIEGNRIIIFNEKSDFDDKEAFHVLMIDDSRIVTSSFDGVKLWKWDTKANTVKLHKYLENEDKGSKVQSVLYCPRINALLFAQNKGLYLYTLTDAKITRISFSSMITAIAIDKSENYIAVACNDYLYLQKIPKDDQLWSKASFVSKFDHCISSLSFCPQKMCLLVSFNTGPIRLINLKGNARIQVTTINADSLSFISNNRFVVASSHEDQPCLIYDLSMTTRETVIPDDVLSRIIIRYGVSYDDYDEAFYKKNGRIIYCLGPDTIVGYNLKNKKEKEITVRCPTPHECCGKLLSPDGKRAIYSYKDGSMFLINGHTGECIKLLEKTESQTKIHSASFSGDSKYIATTSKEGINRLYLAEDGSFIQRLPSPSSHWGNSIEFNNVGNMILCASQDYYIYIWKKNEEKKRFYLNKTLAGHEERVCCASFSSDGRMVVSASPSKVIVWDIESEIPLEVIEMKKKEYGLRFVKFSPDDTRIFTSSEGKLVVIEFPKLQKLITTTRERFKNRKLTLEEKKKYYLE